MEGLIAAEHLGRYWLAADLAGGLEVLDAGCGVGYGSEMIARAGASRVVGIDLAPDAIATASERAGELVDFQVADVRDLPFDEGAFDLVVCFEVLEHLEDPEPVIAGLKGVLRDGGLLVTSSPNRGVYPPGNPHHLHEFTLEELRDALSARFANVVLMRQRPWLASLIDAGVLAAPGEDAVGASVAKAGDVEEAWTYVVALASDADIAQPGALAVLADPSELRDLQEAVGTGEAGRQKLRTALDASNESREKLREAFEVARADREALREAIVTANEDRARLRGALEAATVRHREAERNLRALESSRSWRITRPLRAAGAALRRQS